MRNFMLRAFVWLLLIAMPICSLADTDIYKVPTEEQLSEKEALQIASNFFEGLYGTPLTQPIATGEYTALFGPGYQWSAKTDEDCWVISIPFGADLTIYPFITIHGTTGEVLYWSFRDKATSIVYTCTLPDESMISAEEAKQIALAAYATECGLKDIKNECAPNSTAFGQYSDIISDANEQYGNMMVWEIGVRGVSDSSPMIGNYVISATDGMILEKTLVEDPAYRK